MNTIALEWKEFLVDVSKVNIYFRINLSSNYDGLICNVENATVAFVEEVTSDDADKISAYWGSLNEHSFDPTPEELALQGLDARMVWGASVIKQFRLYSMGMSDENGIAMLSNMMDVKMTLDLGMLAAAAALLDSKPEDALLDAQFSDTDSRTVRQRFVDMILTEGPTP